MAPPDKSPQDTERRPTMLIVLLIIIVLGIASFLILRPGGKGTTNQSTPTSSDH